MNEKEALEIIRGLVHRVSGKDIEIVPHYDLRRDEILDSLDILIFFMELEKQTGVSIPDTSILIKDGWYQISKICKEIISTSSKNSKD